MVDTGCSCSVSSMRAADLLQSDRSDEEGCYWSEVTPSDKRFGFANGHSHRCDFQVTQEFSHGLLAGEVITLQILDQPGNSTAPLLSISDVANLGGILDLKESTISIRGRAPYRAPKTTTGLMIIPVTKSAVERWSHKMASEESSLASVSEPVQIEDQSEFPDLPVALEEATTTRKPSSPVLSTLTKHHRNSLRNQMHSHREETSLALMHLRSPTTRVSTLASPILWSPKDGIEQVDYLSGRTCSKKIPLN